MTYPEFILELYNIKEDIINSVEDSLNLLIKNSNVLTL